MPLLHKFLKYFDYFCTLSISIYLGAKKQGLLAHLGNLYPSLVQNLQQDVGSQQQDNEKNGLEPAAGRHVTKVLLISNFGKFFSSIFYDVKQLYV